MTVPVWYASFATGAVVLAAAGLAKLVRPADTARALRTTGLPAQPWMVQVGAGVEVVAGLVALAAGGAVAVAVVAGSYLALAAFVGVALVRRTPLSSCGCFGEPDTPPTTLHVLIDLGLAAAALLAARHPVRGLPAVVADSPAHGVVLLALIATAAYAVVTVLTALPRLAAVGARR
jgi:hypothetical protein